MKKVNWCLILFVFFCSFQTSKRLHFESKNFQPEMVFVEGGDFVFKEYFRDSLELNTFLSDFYMSKFKITEEEYNMFLTEIGQTDDLYTIREKNLPCLRTWTEADAYCRWLSKKTGENYRLPTAVEWQYAAKGGNKSKNYKYPGSDNLYEIADSLPKYTLGTHKCNELGLHDMFGLFCEWNSDDMSSTLWRYFITECKEKVFLNPYFCFVIYDDCGIINKNYSGFKWYKNDVKYAGINILYNNYYGSLSSFRVVKSVHNPDTIKWPLKIISDK